MATILHDSGCAQHNEPAYPNGPCDCGAAKLIANAETRPSDSGECPPQSVNDLVKQIICRTPAEQYDLAFKVAENVGYMLVREPDHPDSPHAPQSDDVREALVAVLADIAEYERVNNLAPNPGRKYCWDSVARAYAALQPQPNGGKTIPLDKGKGGSERDSIQEA